MMSQIYEKMNKSESIKEISKAIFEVQKLIPPIEKDQVNNFYNNSYAGLPNILKNIADPLQKTNLTISQFPDGENGLTSILIHIESGEWMEATAKVPVDPEKVSPANWAGCIAQMRRTAIINMLHLNIEDKEEESVPYQTNQPPPPTTTHTNEKPWLNKGTDQYNIIVAEIRLGGIPTIHDVLKDYKLSKQMRAHLEQMISEANNLD